MLTKAPLRQASPDGLTKTKIIDSALTLYAAHGIDGVPVRTLTQHAGVNVAAIHYHFGGAEALAEAVFSELSARINKRRSDALEALMGAAKASGGAADLRDIVTVFVAPYFDTTSSTEGQLLAQLILKHRLSPSPMTERVIKEHFDPMARSFVAALHKAVPGVPKSLMYWRYMFMVSTVVLSTSDRGRTARLQALSGEAGARHSADDARRALIDFVVGGLQATVSWAGHGQRSKRTSARGQRSSLRSLKEGDA